jgi:ATP-binding cassette subfamily B protein
MTLASLRGQIGIVQQDAFLFAGMLRDNIAYGRLGGPRRRSWNALRRARLEDGGDGAAAASHTGGGGARG